MQLPEQTIIIYWSKGLKMKVYIDQEVCTGCELCVQTCPEIFEMNDEGKAEVKIENITPEHEESCHEAAGECPVEAISVNSEWLGESNNE